MRLVLLCHAATTATRAARFPADDALTEGAERRIAALAPRVPGRARVFTSPMRCARDTAAALGLAAADEPALRDADAGRWAGRSMAEIAGAEPDALRLWLTDPAAAPHGGDPDAAVTERVAAWLAKQLASPDPVLGVTHATVIRAALAVVLGAPFAARAVDVRPLTAATFSSDGRRWTLVSLVPP